MSKKTIQEADYIIEHTTPVDRDEIMAMMQNVNALYLAAYEKLREARAAEGELNEKMQEVYGVEKSKGDENHANRQP